MGDNLPANNLGTGLTAKKICTGYRHVCVILNNDRVKCWGSSDFYATGSTTPSGYYPSTMGDGLPFIDFGTGDNKATDIACGYHFTCAIVASGTGSKVKCWGQVLLFNDIYVLVLEVLVNWAEKLQETIHIPIPLT
jgi:hypothetical protein